MMEINVDGMKYTDVVELFKMCLIVPYFSKATKIAKMHHCNIGVFESCL